MTYRDNVKAILEANFIGSRKEYLEGVCAKICEIQLTDKSYEDGLNDAWEAARKIELIKSEGGLSYEDRIDIFGDELSDEILKNLTASEAVAKIKAYEKSENEIKQWDEVIIKKSNYGHTGHKGVVVQLVDSSTVSVMFDYQDSQWYRIDNLEKTGKSYPELENILNQLKEVDQK